ncbi:Putative Release factor glutamine methyltransferase [Avibacterium paragallinarum JF4211]|nr:Putative Release factor glutamine methyltransferase [Avibacterium paragallinarum JF4211]
MLLISNSVFYFYKDFYTFDIRVLIMNYADWISLAVSKLDKNKTADPFMNAKVDAMLLLEFVTGHSRSFILAFSDTTLPKHLLIKLTALLERRANGEPMAYILGCQPFWTLDLMTTPDTLIPRSETEILIENALDCIKKCVTSKNFDGTLTILDLGTGTGAIALALAKELRSGFQNLIKYSVIGVDLVDNAVKLAENNARYNNIENVYFHQSNWFEHLKGQSFDIIVSNPPYIDKEDLHLTIGDVRFEPLTALVSNDEGYADLRHIIINAPAYLKANGWLLVEHGWQQGNKVRSFFQTDFWRNIVTIKDYSHNERVTLAQLIGENR